MSNKNIIEKLEIAFPSIQQQSLSDEYITQHPNLLWDLPCVPLIKAVPLYMSWCARHTEREGELIFGDLISALNAYSRAKPNCSSSMRFAHECSFIQVQTVLQFLFWCKDALSMDYEPALGRAIRNWESIRKLA